MLIENKDRTTMNKISKFLHYYNKTELANELYNFFRKIEKIDIQFKKLYGDD